MGSSIPSADSFKQRFVTTMRDTWMTHSNLRAEFSDCPADRITTASMGYTPVEWHAPDFRSHGGTGGMDLEASTNDLQFRRIVVHEGGHAIGFAHEQDSGDPLAVGCTQQVCAYPDNVAAYRDCLAKEAHQGCSVEDSKQLTSYDQMSVMNYCGPKGIQLSAGDIEGAADLYGAPNPSRGIETSASTLVRGNRIDVVAATLSGSVIHKYFDGDRWLPEGDAEDLGGEVLGTPQAVAVDMNTYDIFAVGMDRAIWTKRWTSSEWTDWTSLGGETRGTPAVVTSEGGRIDIFVRGADAGIYRKYRVGEQWFPNLEQWEKLPGHASMSIRAVSTRDKLRVFSIGWSDNAVHVLASDSRRTFASARWKSLGGYASSDPQVVVRDWVRNLVEVSISDSGQGDAGVPRVAWTTSAPADGNDVWNGRWMNAFRGSIESLEPDAPAWLPADTRRLAVMRDGSCTSRYFVRREDGRVYSWKRSWGTFECLAVPSDAELSAAPGGLSEGSPVVGVSPSGDAVIVVRGEGGDLWTSQRWGLAGPWEPWERLTQEASQIVAEPTTPRTLMDVVPMLPSWGQPSISTVARGTDRLDVFAINPLGDIVHKYAEAGVWAPDGAEVENLGHPPDSLDLGFVGKPEAALTGPDSIDVVGIGFTSRGRRGLYHKRWLNGEWIPAAQEWTPLEGIVTGRPVAVGWPSGRLDIFVKGLDNGIWHKTRLEDGTWFPSVDSYESIGGTLASQITVVRTGDVLRVLGEASDSSLWQISSASGGSFATSRWTHLSDYVGTRLGPAAVALDPESPTSQVLIVAPSRGATWLLARWQPTSNVPLSLSSITPPFTQLLQLGDPNPTSFQLISDGQGYEIFAGLLNQDFPDITISRTVAATPLPKEWETTWSVEPGGQGAGALAVATWPGSSNVVALVRAQDGSVWARRRWTDPAVADAAIPLDTSWYSTPASDWRSLSTSMRFESGANIESSWSSWEPIIQYTKSGDVDRSWK